MSDAFSVGETVVLKSGGPDMTVTSVSKDWGDQLAVYVTWFNDKHAVQTANFPPEALKKA